MTQILKHRRSQYEANRGTRLGKILPNTVDFYFFYQTDNIRRFHTADFVQRTVCSPRLQFLPGYGPATFVWSHWNITVLIYLPTNLHLQADF